MSEVRILEETDAPTEGESRQVIFDHPFTSYPYALGIYFAKGRYLAITDTCKKCNSSLAEGKLEGMYAFCAMEGHPWNIKTGLFKFDRTQGVPTYRVIVKDGGLYIEI